jgi:uncharacterized protein YcaQ
MTPLVLSNQTARHLLLDRQGLSDAPRRTMTATAWQDLIERIGFVQMDSISTVERAHHMILFTRGHGYRQAQLAHLAERRRTLFEHWTHDASLIPTRFFPYWRRRFAVERQRIGASRWWRERGPDLLATVETVRRRIATEGSLMARHFEDGRGRSPAGWWDWGPSKAALEYLWLTGEIAVARRDGFQKVYDLTERVIAAEHRAATIEDGAAIDWACRSALSRLGAATAGEIAAFWNLASPAEAKAWCARHHGRDLVTAAVTGADGRTRTAYALAAEIDRFAATPPPPDTLRILSPFDPVIRDRDRLERLFGFDYRFEAFVPAAKRRYGYYVFPILEGDRFIGRIDAKADRASGVLRVAGLWWEPGIRAGKARQARLDGQLGRLARFAGLDGVDGPASASTV